MVLTLYQDMFSQPTRAVWMLLKINGIDFVENTISLSDGAHLADTYTKDVPAAQVPAIRDDDFILTESVAILQYLCAKYKVKDNWLPEDPKKRARVQQYMAWQHTCTRKHGLTYFMAKFLTPAMTKTKPDDKKVEEAEKDWNKTLDYIEKNFLASTDFLAGNKISIADLLGISEIMQPVAIGFDVEKDRPNLKAWIARVKKELGQTFIEAHMAVMELSPVASK